MAAAIDGFIPYKDPLDFCYDENSPEARAARLYGAAAREIIVIYVGMKVTSFALGPEWAEATLGQRFLASRLWFAHLLSETLPPALVRFHAIATLVGMGIDVASIHDFVSELIDLMNECRD